VGASSIPADTFAAAIIGARERASLKSPGDLAAIEQLSAEDLVRLRPFVTVYSGVASVDMRGADSVVLRAVPGLGRGQMADIVEMRGEAGTDGEGPLSSILAIHGQYLMAEPAARYRIALKATGESGQRAAAQAIVELQDEAPWLTVLAFVPEPAGGAPE
jgi:type II secretory pathway component PulK